MESIFKDKELVNAFKEGFIPVVFVNEYKDRDWRNSEKILMQLPKSKYKHMDEYVDITEEIPNGKQLAKEAIQIQKSWSKRLYGQSEWQLYYIGYEAEGYDLTVAIPVKPSCRYPATEKIYKEIEKLTGISFDKVLFEKFPSTKIIILKNNKKEIKK